MLIARDFEKLKQDLDNLFALKEKIERQIQEKACQIYKLNSECISLGRSKFNDKEIGSLSFEICKYVSEVLQVKLNNGPKDNEADVKQERCSKIDRKVVIEQEPTSENLNNNTIRRPFINTSSYAFQNVYNIDDFMNTTNWLWNNELKSKIIEVASNRNKNLTPGLVKPRNTIGNIQGFMQSYKKKQCKALPKLVCRTVTIEDKEREENMNNEQNPFKSYIKRAFKS
ncbi:hypothetical protein FG386_000782 [Cryptosporidium ryanae]|uniref:uncharacterized protein n=1 Tax=Cryptosporidium ryanae TaxID=515981 RepID=UPI003519E5D6|nr:hypothetical protein FG386_000782 [Cryptosporidium ryanae]